MRDHGFHRVRYVRELSLSRGAARAERRAEAAIRQERENRYSHEWRAAAVEAERRAAAVEAERRRQAPMG